MRIRAAAVSAASPRSHQHMVMAHGVTSNGQAQLRTWQHHHSESLSIVSKTARLALGCSEVVSWLGCRPWRFYLIVSCVCSWNLPVGGVPIDPTLWLFCFGDKGTSNILVGLVLGFCQQKSVFFFSFFFFSFL